MVTNELGPLWKVKASCPVYPPRLQVAVALYTMLPLQMLAR
jgi:hypothetical protein